MKTIPKSPSKFRYQKVKDRHAHVSRRLMDIMQMSPTDYYMHEFENGMNLLDTYFNDSAPAIQLKYVLATEKRYRYWAHYRLGRRECESTFWNTYQYVYTDNVACEGEQYAARRLREEWLLEMKAYNHLNSTHEHLRQHLLQTDIPI